MSRILIVAAVALCIPGHLMAQSAPRGAEFQVNSFTTGSQSYPSIAMRSDGAFVVVWTSVGQDGSGDGVFSRLYDGVGAQVGGEFQVNTYTTSSQAGPAIAMDASGAFVIVWHSGGQNGPGWHAFGQRFDSAATPLGGEFQISAYTTRGQYGPVVAMDSAGAFVVAWHDSDDGSFGGVFGQRFDSLGAAQGGEFQVNTYTTGHQNSQTIAMNGAGEFVVGWRSYGQGGPHTNVFSRRYDSSGVPITGELQVNTDTSAYHTGMVSAIDPDGGFVVAWYSYGQGDLLGNAFLRRYDSLGNPQGGQLQVNSWTTGYQIDPALGMSPTGDFVVAWSSYTQDGSVAGIMARSFDSSGALVGGEFQVNTYTTSYQGQPAVRMDSTGGFVVAWASAYQDGSSRGVFGQRFCADEDGDLLCDDEDILVSSPIQGAVLDCSDPQFMQPEIEWTSGNYDRFRVFLGSDPGLAAGTRVTSGDSWLKTTTWTPPRKKWKNACNKALNADPNNPVMYIEVVGVDVDLRKSDPHRTTLSQIVQVDLQQ